MKRGDEDGLHCLGCASPRIPKSESNAVFVILVRGRIKAEGRDLLIRIDLSRMRCGGGQRARYIHLFVFRSSCRDVSTRHVLCFSRPVHTWKVTRSCASGAGHPIHSFFLRPVHHQKSTRSSTKPILQVVLPTMADAPKSDGLPEGAKYEAPKPPPKQNPVFRMMGEFEHFTR